MIYLERKVIKKKMVNKKRSCFCNSSVTPSGFEPKSSEPESEILSIELWGLILSCFRFRHHLPAFFNKKDYVKNDGYTSKKSDEKQNLKILCKVPVNNDCH